MSSHYSRRFCYSKSVFELKTAHPILILSRNADLSSVHTLNGDTKVSLVLSCRVGDHTGVLAFMGQHGVLNGEGVATLLNASMDVSSQQLKTKRMHEMM